MIRRTPRAGAFAPRHALQVLDQAQADAVVLVLRQNVGVAQERRVARILEPHHGDQGAVQESAVPREAPSFVVPLGGRHLRVVELVGREEVPVPARGGVDDIHRGAPVGDCQRADRHLGHGSKYPPGGPRGKVKNDHAVYSAIDDGKVALVTGASRGIGRSIALALAAAGYAVVVNFASRRGDADATTAAITAGGGTAVALQADVSDAAAVARMFAAVDERFGRLDALVNNAGIGRRVDRLTDIDDETWRRTLAVNLDGAFFCMRAAIPRLQAAGGGRIVNISSGAARTGGAIGAHYAASKAGMLALTAKAARELAREGIAVNAVLPSVIETEMLDAVAPDAAARARVMAQFPIGRFGRPEEVARVVRFLVAEAPDYLTGEFISLRGGRL